jgi:arsenate reductase (thioredoxin)
MVKVMFLCTGNSCRSQMAEGLARRLGNGLLEVHSAGVMPVGVNPNAVKVMAEIGIDISGQTSKGIEPELLDRMDYIITLCGHADMLCPKTPEGVEKIHWPIDDPIKAIGTEEKVLGEFRRARDEIKGRVVEFIREVRGRVERPAGAGM